MRDSDIGIQLQEQVKAAAATAAPLCIGAGDSKSFYGRAPVGERIDVSTHRGIVSYEPTELVITARAGTPLRAIEQTLADNNQMLAFEPPHFGATATLGGTIACNLSGPRRPYAGAARDFVLGTRIINGRGEILRFGGEVMKNVAGYDVSRLMTGALGTLGILLDISLKVLPRPETELTLAQQTSTQQALDRMHALSRLPLPVSASLYDGDTLFVRLSGTARGVDAARDRVGGDEVAQGAELWSQAKEHRHAFFAPQQPLWRLSLASTAAPLGIHGQWLYEWGGAQRWLLGHADARAVRSLAQAHGGHATLYRGDPDREQVFHPLPAGLMNLHRRLKQAFDPHGIFNPGRMYREL
jgi:glycolate oxidase FAD binding subunit